MDEMGTSQEEAFKDCNMSIEASVDQRESCVPEFGGNRVHSIPFIEIQTGKPVFSPLGNTDCTTCSVISQCHVKIKTSS